MSIYDQIANAGNSWQFGTAAMKVREASDNRKLAEEESARRDAQAKRAEEQGQRSERQLQMQEFGVAALKGREFTAQNLAQFSKDVETFGEERALELADERESENAGKLAEMFPSIAEKADWKEAAKKPFDPEATAMQLRDADKMLAELFPTKKEQEALDQARQKFDAEMEAVRAGTKASESTSNLRNAQTDVVREELKQLRAGGAKKYAIDRKMEIANQVMNKTGQYANISDEEQAAYLDALGMQKGPKGSVTINYETANDMADEIIDSTGIGENRIQSNDQEFQQVLAMSIMMLAKDGKYMGQELVDRALVQASGFTWDDAQNALAFKKQEAKDSGKDPNSVTLKSLLKAAND